MLGCTKSDGTTHEYLKRIAKKGGVNQKTFIYILLIFQQEPHQQK